MDYVLACYVSGEEWSMYVHDSTAGWMVRDLEVLWLGLVEYLSPVRYVVIVVNVCGG